MAATWTSATPHALPITVEQFRLLVDHDQFSDRVGQVELIYGKIVETNPQGPQHADPIDELELWSHDTAADHFRIRTEKPIEIPGLYSSPEPDLVWATKRRYVDRHPEAADVHLLVEVSGNSRAFDRGEKLRLYAEAGILEYWIVDIVAKTIEVMTEPEGSVYKKMVIRGLDGSVSPICLPSAVLRVAQVFYDSTL